VRGLARALKGALVGATSTITDLDLCGLAATQPGGFEQRSGHIIFSTHYTDEIPGRAPTRAIFCVRAISAAGVPGFFSEVIGPVYVPDVCAAGTDPGSRRCDPSARVGSRDRRGVDPGRAR
jgi:hypothetical protein